MGKTAGAEAGPPPPAGLRPEQAAEVLAKVGDKTITLGDYAATLERMDQFDRLRYQSPERRKELLDEIIDAELLAQDARKKKLDEQPETRQAVRQILRDALLTDARKGLPAPADIPESEVRAYYEAKRESFREPERRRVAHIAVKDKDTAAKVLAAAK
ncbi:MAG TPA: peptidylprolyl isomerase, partial [Polyangiaceae bacterium]